MMTEIIAQSRPVIALSGMEGMPVTLASVVIGMPIDPNATGRRVGEQADARRVKR